MCPRIPRVEFDPADLHMLDVHAAGRDSGVPLPGDFEAAWQMGQFAD
jgi:hypothetical protein